MNLYITSSKWVSLDQLFFALILPKEPKRKKLCTKTSLNFYVD